MFFLQQVVISHATDLFFDHPNEPDPEERGYYWASRFTNTRKVFGFTPEHLLKNAQVSRKGIPLTRSDVCPEFGCVELTEPSNIIGKIDIDWLIFDWFIVISVS